MKTGICAKPMAERGYIDGTVCPVIPTPVGTGILIAGGNYNSVDGNQLYDNWRQGTMQIWVPAPLRDEYDPTKHARHQQRQPLHRQRAGHAPPRAWSSRTAWTSGGTTRARATAGRTTTRPAGAVRTNSLYPGGLPTCDDGGSLLTPGALAVQGAGFLGCTQYNRDDPQMRTPPDCDWFDSPRRARGAAVRRRRARHRDRRLRDADAQHLVLAAGRRGARRRQPGDHRRRLGAGRSRAGAPPRGRLGAAHSADRRVTTLWDERTTATLGRYRADRGAPRRGRTAVVLAALGLVLLLAGGGGRRGRHPAAGGRGRRGRHPGADSAAHRPGPGPSGPPAAVPRPAAAQLHDDAAQRRPRAAGPHRRRGAPPRGRAG